MNYRILATWNGQPVLDGACTKVVGADVARGFFAEQFAGGRFQQWLQEQEWLDRLDRLPNVSGVHRAWQWADETGSAFVRVSRV